MDPALPRLEQKPKFYFKWGRQKKLSLICIYNINLITLFYFIWMESYFKIFMFCDTFFFLLDDIFSVIWSVENDVKENGYKFLINFLCIKWLNLINIGIILYCHNHYML